MKAIDEKNSSILGQLKDNSGLVEGKLEYGKVKVDREEDYEKEEKCRFKSGVTYE